MYFAGKVVPVTGDDGGTDATGEVPADRYPVRCSNDRFAAPAVSAGFRLFNLSAKFFGGVPNNIDAVFHLCPQMPLSRAFVLLFSLWQCRT